MTTERIVNDMELEPLASQESRTTFTAEHTMSNKPELQTLERALADLFARDIEREIEAGRPDNADAIAAMLGIELPPSDVRVVTE